MPRNEMYRPLKRLSLGQRLWRRRPPALVSASVALGLLFLGGGLWLSRLPAPLAGQPVVMAAIPEDAEIITASVSYTHLTLPTKA